MRGAGARRRLFGVALAVLFLSGTGLALARWHLDQARRHVVVELFNVDDEARASVDCQQALRVPAGERSGRVDLGWLRPDDRIFVAARNRVGEAAWGYRIRSNGVLVAEAKRGAAGARGFAAGEHTMVMEKAFTASGSYLGRIGCDGPRLVSSEVAGYQRSPDAAKVPIADLQARTWSAPRFPYAAIDLLAGPALWVLAAVGFLLAFFWPPLHRLLWEHPLASAVLAAVSFGLNFASGLDLQSAIVAAQVVGCALLALAAAVALAPHTASRCQTSSSTRSPKPS